MMKAKYVIFLLLLALCSCTTETRRAEMRGRLQALNALNRADSVLTATDRDEAQELADFFDAHGTSNEQMLAHYLLGRCYADMREAPMALHCYQKAISRADTTSQDCDFAQLSRVYGQSATIFYQQGLYRNALEYDDLCSDYSWRGKDTLNAILSYAKKAVAYNQLQMKDSAILIYTYAINQLKAFNYNKVAAGFAGTLAKKLIDKGETSEAEPFMQDYEQHSGYFDSAGNIAGGREVYYFAKGLYYLNRSLLDSAEYYFRKELRTGKDFNNQNGGAYGLGLLYQQKHKSDSAAKYFAYSYAMNDSCFVQMTTHEVEQAKAMYDYSRQQEKAQREKQKAEELRRLLWYVIICIAAASIVVTRLFYRQSKERAKQRIEYEELLNVHIDMQAEVMQLRLHKENYDKLLREKEELDERLGHTHTEIEELRTAKSQLDTLIAQKEDELEQQKVKIESYKQVKVHQDETEKQLRGSSVYKLLSEKTNRGAELTDAEWKLVERFVIDSLPEFYRFVSSREYALTTRMYRICILTRLQFPNKAIGCMLGVSAPSISQTRPIIYKKLFGEDDNVKDLGEKLQMFC